MKKLAKELETMFETVAPRTRASFYVVPTASQPNRDGQHYTLEAKWQRPSNKDTEASNITSHANKEVLLAVRLEMFSSALATLARTRRSARESYANV